MEAGSFLAEYAHADQINWAATHEADVPKHEWVYSMTVLVNGWNDDVALFRNTNLATVGRGCTKINGAIIGHEASVTESMTIGT